MTPNLQRIKLKKSLFRKVGKYLLIGYTGVTIIIIVFLVWIYSSYFSGPNAMQLNSYHPFKSEAAKNEYLDYYTNLSAEWPLESEERMVSTSYGETFIRISGPSDAPPMVLLPGGGATSLMWTNNIKELSENYRTYALDDIYDWGLSVYTKKMNCPESIVNWLDELFAALELEDSINLIGASYGAWKTSQYLLAHPERINKGVFLCPAYTVYRGNKEFEKRVFRGFIPLRYYMKKELYWSCDDMVQTPEGRTIADDHLNGLWLAIRSFKTKIPAPMTVLSDVELKSIEAPVLYLAGENEKMYSVHEAVGRLNRISPNIKTEVVPNTGHCLMFTHPELVNKKILDFLKD